MDDKTKKRKKLRQELRYKISEGQISRSNKQNKELILEKNLKKMGLDKDKLKADIEAVNKQGGLTLNLSK
jgi:hypothetical protein